MSMDDIVRATLPKPMLMARCENRAFLVAGFESPEECKAFIYAINTASPANDRAITDEQILDLSLRFIPNDDRRARDSQIIDFVHAVLAAAPPQPPLPSAQRVAVDFYVMNPHCAQTDFEQRLVDAAPTQGADARPVAMTNGSFHCPACGEAMKGPLACGHCLWQKPEAVDAEIGADGIATRDAAPSDAVNARLAKFLDVAAGEGYVFDGIDAGELFLELFPDYFKNAAIAPRGKT